MVDVTEYVPMWPTPSGPKYPIPKDDGKGGGGTGPYGGWEGCRPMDGDIKDDFIDGGSDE